MTHFLLRHTYDLFHNRFSKKKLSSPRHSLISLMLIRLIVRLPDRNWGKNSCISMKLRWIFWLYLQGVWFLSSSRYCVLPSTRAFFFNLSNVRVLSFSHFLQASRGPRVLEPTTAKEDFSAHWKKNLAEQFTPSFNSNLIGSFLLI